VFFYKLQGTPWVLSMIVWCCLWCSTFASACRHTAITYCSRYSAVLWISCTWLDASDDAVCSSWCWSFWFCIRNGQVGRRRSFTSCTDDSIGWWFGSKEERTAGPGYVVAFADDKMIASYCKYSYYRCLHGLQESEECDFGKSCSCCYVTLEWSHYDNTSRANCVMVCFVVLEIMT